MRIFRKHEGGQALIMATLGLFAIFGILGLVVDLGWANFRKQAEQSAAESAALAAVEAAQTAFGNTPTCAALTTCSTTPVPCTTAAGAPNNIQVGCYYAKVNGFTVGGNNGTQNVTMASSVSPTLPPSVAGDPADFKVIKGFAAGAQPSYWVTARVTEVVPQLFSAILGNKSMTSSARATAGIVYTAPGGCIYVLDQAADKDALLVDGAGALNVPNCAIYVNNGCTVACNSFEVNGGGASVTASSIQVYKKPGETGCPVSGVCNVNVSGGGKVDGSTSAPYPNLTNPTPAPPNGFADPLCPDPLNCSQAAPIANTDYQACTAANQSTCCANVDSKGKLINSYTGTVVLSPGTYCGGINIQGGATVTLNSGNYYLLGSSGGNALNVSSSNIYGNGVFFYSTVDPSWTQLGALNFSASGGTLSAPTSGPYKNILYFEERSGCNYNTSSNCGLTDQFQGGNGPGNTPLTVDGIMYTKSSTFLVSATGLSGSNLAVVANKLHCQGACNFGSTELLPGGGTPSVAAIALIE